MAATSGRRINVSTCCVMRMDAALPKTSVAEHLANTVVTLDAGSLPAAVRRTCEDLLIDVAGLCVTVREADYIQASLAGWEDDGPCTAIGHRRTMTAAGAAFVNTIPEPPSLSPWTGLGVLALWVVLAVTVALVQLRRRDA